MQVRGPHHLGHHYPAVRQGVQHAGGTVHEDVPQAPSFLFQRLQPQGQGPAAGVHEELTQPRESELPSPEEEVDDRDRSLLRDGPDDAGAPVGLLSEIHLSRSSRPLRRLPRGMEV